jgi:hypothetical protein
MSMVQGGLVPSSPGKENTSDASRARARSLCHNTSYFTGCLHRLSYTTHVSGNNNPQQDTTAHHQQHTYLEW